MSTVLLFDIDGTLILTGGAGRRALERAFATMCGRPDACDEISFGGMTDRAIARAGLCAIRHADDEAAIDRVLEYYLEYLQDEVARSEQYRVMPGVYEVLEAVRGLPGVAVGLGTGNLERGARVKLARGGLHEAFPFGGFGCDHEDRPTLLRTGALRGAQRLGTALEACRVVIIGDTPRDVEAALAIGAECIGVGTGGFSPEALLQRGATRAFQDLSVEGVLEALLDPPSSPRFR